ncbi:hypothetical protein [[Clostridium] polysaccharolyticum]|uniref:Uncharacterized protein n=1 Tax=[Clostridium] polysaccharolyticum TaxID=29364 RepID=A0A1I0C9I6_9FIRM|nr:hypothetical protein [[Clostridium] polysaccharolyticum]SET16172.1 hypothetical protein SAMN04487772_10982 [[Clostridium] polysaccharolyticum]
MTKYQRKITITNQRMGILIPFKTNQQGKMDHRVLSILFFAKRILDKYSMTGMYGFDPAAMVLLEKIAEQEKPEHKNIQKQIEFTVNMMLLRQNRNRLAQDIIKENTAFQKNITNHVMVNLNRLLSVDKRVYSELNQISRNDVKIREAYDRIVKLENYEKKLVFQVQNQQTVKPEILKQTFYHMFQRMMKQSQFQLSTQIFKESIERKQFKQNLNKLLELKTLRKDMERREFLHVMKSGSLEERREALNILKDAVLEVNQTVMKKQISSIVRNELVNPLVYKEFHINQNKPEKKEIQEIKQYIVNQQAVQNKNSQMFAEIKKTLVKQDQLVQKVIKEQESHKKQDSSSAITRTITNQIKSELHLDRMRYGME